MKKCETSYKRVDVLRADVRNVLSWVRLLKPFLTTFLGRLADGVRFDKNKHRFRLCILIIIKTPVILQLDTASN